VNRRQWIVSSTKGLAAVAVVSRLESFRIVAGPEMMVRKRAGCSCCDKWVDHLQRDGFVVRVEELPDAELTAYKKSLGVPNSLFGCHTGVIDGLIVEGHVPARYVQRALANRRGIVGVGVAGMPTGSPGMEMDGVKGEPYEVVSFTKDGKTAVFAHVTPE
jgi:hypothetical protein